jgi:hypothetical protein
MFLFLLKNLYPYPRIGVFLEIAYPRIRYVSYPIHVPVSVHPSRQGMKSCGPKKICAPVSLEVVYPDV